MADVVSLGFRTDLMLLALSGSSIRERDGALVIRSPFNPTHYWGNFLLLPGPIAAGDVADVLERFHAEIPDARHVAIGIDGTDGATVADAGELTSAGLTLDVATVLTARADDLLDPRHPSTADVRPLDPDSDDDWQQALLLKEAVNDVEEVPEQDYRTYASAYLDSRRDLQRAGHGAWFGAFENGTLVAGLGVYSDGSGVARYQTVETHPEHRRHGHAGSLVTLAGRWAAEHLDAHTLVIVADPEYVAIGLYRALGFTGTEAQVQLERRPPTE